MQLVEQPVQRLGQDGQPAIVLDQFKARREGLQGLFFLGTNEQRGRHRLGLARLNSGHRGDHGGAVAAVSGGGADIHSIQGVGPCSTCRQYPGAGKVMLHHGDIAVVCFLFKSRTLLFDLAELYLLVLLGLGINRWTCESGIEGGLACWLVAIAHQLQIQLWRQGRAGSVGQLVLDGNVVCATAQGVGLDQLQSTYFGGGEGDDQFVLAIFQSAVTTDRHDRFVGWRCTAGCTRDDAGLRQVHTVFGIVQQHEVADLVCHVRVFEELGAHQGSTFCVKGQFQHIGAHFKPFAGHSGRSGRDRCRTRLGGGYGHQSISFACWRRGCRSGSLGRAREEGGFIAVVDLPLVPKQHHGKTKDHPQDGAANIVHEVFFSEGEEIRRPNSRGRSTGTGSCPPSHQGWQRAKRAKVR